jgi:hypothetical protein
LAWRNESLMMADQVWEGLLHGWWITYHLWVSSRQKQRSMGKRYGGPVRGDLWIPCCLKVQWAAWIPPSLQVYKQKLVIHFLGNILGEIHVLFCGWLWSPFWFGVFMTAGQCWCKWEGIVRNTEIMMPLLIG